MEEADDAVTAEIILTRSQGSSKYEMSEHAAIVTNVNNEEEDSETQGTYHRHEVKMTTHITSNKTSPNITRMLPCPKLPCEPTSTFTASHMPIDNTTIISR
eukprot:TRINITY_DN369_c0_g1_i2.p2 TRINITY_DN369_c0_g1~~TRINITY_DN369_c0_g1_i2.p2  ORF type:complete len:101 (+),score=5.45 TRINITY_DN369_c0_g1_i2:847-1149(+)